MQKFEKREKKKSKNISVTNSPAPSNSTPTLAKQIQQHKNDNINMQDNCSYTSYLATPTLLIMIKLIQLLG